MGLTVYAEGLGFFHKGSGGTGVAPGDTCLSPPPPPTGPAPIPYVNSLSASDLSNGSKTVKIDGEPTALEDSSYISTSTGDEGGTQGGNVVTHKTKGKGYFKSWSETVKVEGKGVCRHSDTMGQNSGSSTVGCVDPSAVTRVLSWLKPENIGKPCPDKPARKYKPPTEEQYARVRGGPCWSCPNPSGVSGRKDPMRYTPDHQPPQGALWDMGGCHQPDDFYDYVTHRDSVLPHCSTCSPHQGGTMSNAECNSFLKTMMMAWP
ncbi:DUF4150 domain-containing protein [Paraburkholderia monticola]|uniref:DUF4150 domain-containing protein n=1 Tax=Paraburkholderia monticola TaxID=1399968 RepID=UPI00094FA4A1|nr:DUF4150 domain-containing protein [Paraburkholderia monticola]